MREWANWTRQPLKAGVGYKPSSLNLLMAGGTPGGGGFHSSVLSYGTDCDAVFVLIDAAVRRLPVIPRAVIKRYYQQVGTADQMANDLGISKKYMYKTLYATLDTIFSGRKLQNILSAA
nr:MAG TPA: antitermination protein Q [Caudoviricetes sp.]